MRGKTPQIVALGGGGFSMERDSSLLDDYVLSLIEAERPRVCFLPTASGDADHYVVRFYRRFAPTCDASHVSLFRRDQGTGGVEDDLASHLLAQDLIYVGGGNVLSMLGAWRAHGLDDVLRRAWRKGLVLCGPSAGSLCWFEEALSAFRWGRRDPTRGQLPRRGRRAPASRHRRGAGARIHPQAPKLLFAASAQAQSPSRRPRRHKRCRAAPGIARAAARLSRAQYPGAWARTRAESKRRRPPR